MQKLSMTCDYGRALHLDIPDWVVTDGHDEDLHAQRSQHQECLNSRNLGIACTA